MRLKHLESALSSIQREFPSPDITLEQYPTSPHLAASIALEALNRSDIGPGQTVVDLGCGTGMLALACAMVDTDHIIAIDCDLAALRIAIENAHDLELQSKIEFIHDQVQGPGQGSSHQQNNQLKCRGSQKTRSRRGGRGHGNVVELKKSNEMEAMLLENDGLSLRSNCVDTVITNPPFGTKNNAGMDVRFLRTATRLATRAVYSFHKTSTRQYLVKKVREWGMDVEVLAEMKFDIPHSYDFHKEKNVDVAVDLLRVLLSKERNEDRGELEAE